MRRHMAWRIARRVAPLGIKFAAQAAMNSRQRSMHWTEHERHSGGPAWAARSRLHRLPRWMELWSEWQPELAELFWDGPGRDRWFTNRQGHRHGPRGGRRIKKAIAVGLAIQALRGVVAMSARRARGDEFGPGHHGTEHGGPGGGDWGNGPFPFGGRGPRMWGKFGERIFGRGDMKFAILDLLRERPMHGYEIIKEMESRSGGMYSPSPGSIYPTLQLLEDRGFVACQATDGRTTYTITEAGRTFLQGQLDTLDAMRDHKHRPPHDEPHTKEAHGHGPWKGDFGPGFGRGFNFGEGFDWKSLDRQEVRTIVGDLREIGRLMVMIFRSSAGNPQKLTALHESLRRTRDDLDKIFQDNRSGEPPIATL